MRCRDGAKSGLASGTRSNSMISPPTCVKRVLNAVSASVPGAHSLTSVTTRLRPFLIAHSAQIQACGAMMKPTRTKYGDLVVVMEAPELMHKVAFLASVTSCATASVHGVMPMPTMSILSLTIISWTMRRALSAEPASSRMIDLDLAAGDAVAVLLPDRPSSRQ